MFRGKVLSYTLTTHTHSMVSRKICLYEYIPQQRGASMTKPPIPLGSFSRAQESIAKISIAAISALQTPLLHTAECRNYQQVPKLDFFSPRLAS